MSSTNDAIPYWTREHAIASLPLRQEDGHKGTYGTGLLLAGTRDMPGAALLAALGAMRSGLGKLEIAIDSEAARSIVSLLPEATYIRNGLEKIGQSELELSRYRAIAAGPGLPPDEGTQNAVDVLLAYTGPLVLDAGALSRRPYPLRVSPTILTPHPLEFARMTGLSPEEVADNRLLHLQQSAQEWGTAIVLKGHETLIAFPDGELWKNPTGNSALGKGGSGDTLTGMLLGMLCCHENWRHAVLNAVYLHGACADEWIRTRSAHTMLAHEITSMLPYVWKQHERS